MRIGFIIYGNPATLTGGYLYDRIVVKGLINLGHEVEVISIPFGSYLQRLQLGFFPGACLPLRNLFAGKFDVLIQDELCHPSLFLVNTRLRQQRERPLLVALVHHILSDEPRLRLQNKILAIAERAFLASVDGFIHNSTTTRKKVATLVDHQRPEVVAYPAGDRLGKALAPETIIDRSLGSGPLQLLFLGNVIPRKGLLPLLAALTMVNPNIWKLSIVGGLDFDLEYTAKVRREIDRLALSNSVQLLGPLTDKQLIEILKVSHIFCMPYAYEGFGIAILEAMAFGLPAFGCRSGAAGETIDHGENGFLLEMEDLMGLAPLLRGLHQDRQELQRLALAALTTYIRHPSWQKSIDDIDRFLHKMKNAAKTSIYE